MNLNKIKDLIEKHPMYIATSTPKGLPHVIVVACVKILDSKKILVTDNYMTITRKNIIANKKADILIYDKKWKGYNMKCSAKYHKSGKWLDFVKGMKENRTHPAKGAIIFTAAKITKVE